MQLVTLDLETFYDREYSLSKLTTEAYVRSHLFETIGIAIKVEDEYTEWYPQPEVEQALASINWSECAVLAQNTMFDGAILRWKYGINPAAWLDTMGMSRALFPHEKSHSLKSQAERAGVGVKGDEVVNALGKRYKDFDVESLARYASYCMNDVDLTYKLFKRYIGMGFPRIELRLIDLTLRMFIDPVLELDRELLKEHLQDVLDKKEALLSKLSADDKSRLMSNPQLADMLREHGVEPPMKISPKTGKETYAFAKTDEAFKALLEHEDLEVQAVVAARLGVKSTLEETRTQRFIDMSYRGAFPVPLRYYGAHSGRWSGQDNINLQNLPSRTANAGKLKKAIKAPPGHIVIDSDSSQIEARTLAWLAGQDDLVNLFMKNNEEILAGIPKKEFKYDPYKIMASHIYGMPPEKINDVQRFIGKTTVLGCGYGVGHAKMKLFLKTGAGVEVSEAEAKRIVDTYRKTYYRIPELWKSSDTALAMLAAGMRYVVDTRGIVRVEPGKGLTLPNGLYIQYPGLRQDAEGRWSYDSRGKRVDVYGGKCTENYTQAIARCVIAEQMLRIAKRYKVVLTVHDSVAIVAQDSEREEAMKYVEECMWWRPSWAFGLPLACEADWGYTYGG
jgi:DNA polymerase